MIQNDWTLHFNSVKAKNAGIKALIMLIIKYDHYQQYLDMAWYTFVILYIFA